MKTLRINDIEREELRKLAIHLNKKLVNMNMKPLQDSEIIHRLLIQAIKRAELDEEGKVIIK